MAKKFIGRETELATLQRFKQEHTPAFIVVQGRRRVGKSRLLHEFAKSFTHCLKFVGLAPEEGVSQQHQKNEFMKQLSQQCQVPFAEHHDWSDLFWHLGQQLPKGPTLIMFDEVSWMAAGDATFSPKVKNLWDECLKNHKGIIFVLCGSASSWIEKHILNSTGFVGRVSYTLVLEPLTLPECNAFWPKRISAYEKLKLLSVTGGIPKYLEEVQPKISAEDNIQQLCFTKGGFLVKEFERIFAHLFNRNSPAYKKILMTLAQGAKSFQDIAKSAKLHDGGRLSEYLEELRLSGFISCDYTWNVKTGRDGRLLKYRLKDNYTRFYLKYIEPVSTQIDRGSFTHKTLASLPQWHSIMGLQFENLVLANRRLIQHALHLHPIDIITDNPFFQNATQRQAGCQIDYLIQTRSGSLYACEIKFSQHAVGYGIIAEMEQKLSRVSYPKGLSIRPVLIYVNGVDNMVKEADYFAALIDFSEYLK